MSRRESIAAMALFRDASGRYLTQWSDTWHALHFIGGHVETGENFREAVLREIEEELGLAAAQLRIPADPRRVLRYTGFSDSAGVDTDYVMAVFDGEVTDPSAELLESGGAVNRWVSADEITALTTTDGLKISRTVPLILGKLAATE